MLSSQLLPMKTNSFFDYSDFLEKKEIKTTIENILLHYDIPKDTVIRCVKAAYLYGKRYDIKPLVILAIGLRESRLNSLAVSITGAIGIGQMTIAAAKHSNIDRKRLIEIECSIYSISKRISDSKAKTILYQVAMYGSFRRAKLSTKKVANSWYYLEFLKHYFRLKKHNK